MHRVVSPFQGLAFVIVMTQGGAALCPGLICSSPFGAMLTLKAVLFRGHPAVDVVGRKAETPNARNPLQRARKRGAAARVSSVVVLGDRMECL